MQAFQVCRCHDLIADDAGYVDAALFGHSFPPPAVSKHCHYGFARRRITVRWRAVLVVAVGKRPQPWLVYRRGRGPALCLERSPHAPALWRRGEVQLDRLSAGTRARLDGELSGAGLEDQRRDLLGAIDADPGAEHPAARAVATLLVRCQPEALAHHASTLAAAQRRWECAIRHACRFKLANDMT